MSAKCEKKFIYKLSSIEFKTVLLRHERLLQFVANNIFQFLFLNVICSGIRTFRLERLCGEWRTCDGVKTQDYC